MSLRSPKSHIMELLILGIGVLLIGWVSGQLLFTSLIALAAYASWHVLNAVRLVHWLRFPEQSVPESFGIWTNVFDEMARLMKRNLDQRERYQSVIGDFQGLTDAFPDATLVVDESNNITWFNNSAQKLLDLKTAEDLGQPVTNLIRLPDFANWLAVHYQIEGRFEMPSPRDDNIWLEVSIVPFREEQRLIILRDISRIHYVNKIRQDFVANISHELRTPLTVILGYLELLEQHPEKEVSEAIGRMQSQAGHMRDLLEDLLELSRLQSDELQNEERYVDVPALLMHLKEQAEEISRGQHHLTFQVDPGLFISGVASNLESAFGNLISNAIKYTPVEGTVAVIWYDSPEGPRLSVRDDGIGIPKRDIPRLTERFYRVGSDRARQSGGTGLGLSIVKHVLNAHQAKLTIESELGEGSEFTCTFPKERKRLAEKSMAAGV